MFIIEVTDKDAVVSCEQVFLIFCPMDLCTRRELIGNTSQHNTVFYITTDYDLSAKTYIYIRQWRPWQCKKRCHRCELRDRTVLLDCIRLYRCIQKVATECSKLEVCLQKLFTFCPVMHFCSCLHCQPWCMGSFQRVPNLSCGDLSALNVCCGSSVQKRMFSSWTNALYETGDECRSSRRHLRTAKPNSWSVSK